MNCSLPALQHVHVCYDFAPVGNLFLSISLVLFSLQSVIRVAWWGGDAPQYLSYEGHGRREMQEVDPFYY